MNRIAIVAIISLFMSLAAFGYAQQPAEDSGPPNQEQPNKPREVSPPPRAPEGHPPRGQEETKPPKHEQEAKSPKTENQEAPRPSGEPKRPAHDEHGTTAQQGRARPTGKSAHIPDPQFKANFGKQHAFTVNRVITTTTIVPNQTQFVVSGFTFIFLDPWPADWLFTDECYIDFVEDQYFLLDVFHPGVRVALFVIEQ